MESKKRKNCNRCGVPMKILDYEWGKSGEGDELITILDKLIDDKDVPKRPINYYKLEIEFCDRCGSIDLHIE